jgi:cellobiose phosphorylase
MARVTFKNGQQQELRGTFCGMVFQNRNGKQFVYQQQQPVLAKKATKEQKAKYEKDCTIQRCVAHIQRSIYEQDKPSVARMQQVADKFHAIKKACERMYEDFLPVFRKNKRTAKLEMAINYWYLYKRMPPTLDLFTDQLPDEYKAEIR